ncbi:olfactory receptor 10T2-like [Podarcis raffonei]|uniref:olfactory receptor 10T2-like n=1 Tax=Podarcis raffonei TaxID=65483 RepID=UPI00232958D0|nr:olfactory receptor 10T2-like [Podarcis raffonei]
MNKGNDSSVTEFLLLGFSVFGKKPTLLFLGFSLIYGTILVFNLTIMSVILFDRTLHSPMYFLLFAFSASETCITFATIPKLLVTLVTGSQSISFVGCAMQQFCFFGFSASNCCLLAAMAYDRYVAICCPLQYHILMNKRVCTQLVAASCVTGCIISLSINTLIFRLPFCGPNGIRHFFCDLLPVLRLACIDESVLHLTNIAIIILCAIVLLGTAMVMFVSYLYIISAILRIPSSLGRQKAFSTCASHLTVVITHFGCASFVYLRPKSSSSLDQDTLISVTYVFLTPLLNPVIYTLRNREVRIAINKLVVHSFRSQKL